ncbi:MAG TPA: hypothetical protein VGS28_01010 [Candidatus Saccharimonadales bacterium]|nr:hypothetical protein [Candidatus Saccharimonadales bacterium]
MKEQIAINQEVNVTAVYFQNKKELKTFPKCIEYDGNTYTFREGLQYLIRRGKDIIRIFEMTDGQSNYRLRCNGEETTWTLVNITPVA